MADKLDLDALEQALDLDGPLGPVMTNGLKRETRALIQRIRDLESVDYFERAEHYESRYVEALNRATSAEAENKRLWNNLHGEQAESRQRIAVLEAVLDAAKDLLNLVDKGHVNVEYPKLRAAVDRASARSGVIYARIPEPATDDLDRELARAPKL